MEMTLGELIYRLRQDLINNPEDMNREIFIECSDSGGSWSIQGLGLNDDKLVLTLDEFNGPPAPETSFYFNKD